MKIYFLLLSLFLFIQLISIIKTKKTVKKKKQESIPKENEDTIEENSEIKETENEKEKSHMMTDVEFELKLQEVLKEKRIKKNFKITKDKLKEIFEAIYENDFALPDLPADVKEEGDKTELDPKEESKRLLNEIFFKLSRSLDYDDEITPSQIKEYISPKRVQVVVGEIVEGLIEAMKDL